MSKIKRLSSFSATNALCLDDILFKAYAFDRPMAKPFYTTHVANYNLSNDEFDILFNYLKSRNFIYEENRNRQPQFAITFKGRIICEQGGLLLLWEKQKSQNWSKTIAITSAIIAVLALISNILFSYFKNC